MVTVFVPFHSCIPIYTEVVYGEITIKMNLQGFERVDMTEFANFKVAFLGMGIMGSSMASNLAQAGCDVNIWNRTSGKPETQKAVEAGAIEHSSLKACIRDRDFIFSCLGDVPDVKSILIGEESVLKYATEKSIIVDFSTIGPDAAKEIGNTLAEASIKFLDAPITGGDVGARQGTLTIMVGGDKDDFETALPLLKIVGKTVELCGPTGSGQSLKLCNQILCAVTMSAVSEAIYFARELGIDPGLVVDVLKDGAGGSWTLTNLGQRIVQDDLKPGFMLKHMLKDLRLVNENKPTDTVELPACQLAEEMFKKVAAQNKTNEEAFGTQAMIKVYK